MNNIGLFISRLALIGAVFATAIGLYSGISGCGGGGGGDDDDDDGTGITIDSVADIPSLNIADYYQAGSGNTSLSALAQEAEGGLGSSCKEFCYTKQCLMETLRHSIELEFFPCMMKKAHEVTGGALDFGANCEWVYYTVIPPPFVEDHPECEGAGGEGEGPPAFKAQAGEMGEIRIRVQKCDSEVKMQMCEGGEQHEEINLTNESDSIDGSATMCWSFEDEGETVSDCGRMAVAANCTPQQFPSTSDCSLDFNAAYDGVFGGGTINFTATGGSPSSYLLDFNFSGGGAGEEEFGTFEVCGYGKWQAGTATSLGIGCFKADFAGSYPAISTDDPGLDWLINNTPPGCETAAAAESVCDNANFDFENEACHENPALCGCPFEPAPANGLCSFDDTLIECCAIAGDTLETQEGAVISQAMAGTTYDEVNAASCVNQITTISFQEPWDCEAEAGKSFTEIDLSSFGDEFAECEELFEDVECAAPGNSCEEEEYKEEGENWDEDWNEGEGCTSDAECGAGEVCEFFGEDPEGFCLLPPPTCTSDAECQAGEVCESIEDQFGGGNFCVPDFTCEEDDECPPETSCMDGHCVFEDAGP